MKNLFQSFGFSLKYRITFVIVFLIFIMMVTVTYIFTIRELGLRVDQVNLRMERLANNIATIRSVETEDWDVYQNYIDNQLRLNPDIVYIAIFDEMNQLRAHSLNTGWIDFGEDRILDRWEQANIVWRLDQQQVAEESRRDIEYKYVNIVIGGHNLGMVKVGFSLVELNDQLRKGLIWNLTLALVFIIVGVTASILMSRQIVKPLGKLTKAMLKISAGDLDQEVHLASKDEIGEMASTFNFMTSELRRKSFIENFSRDLGFSIELERITSLITERITNTLDAKSGFLFIRDMHGTTLYRLVDAYPQPISETVTIDCSSTYYQSCIENPEPIELGEQATETDCISRVQQRFRIGRQALITPIIIQKGLIGLFILDEKKSNKPYTQDEKHFLRTLIGQSGFAVENVLLWEELTEQERLQRELEIARNVQKNLLPQSQPRIAGLDFDGICIPAEEVGGDYYDYFSIDEHTTGIAIADVTGKGTSASFYMAVVKGMMLSLTSIYRSPRQLLMELNRKLYGVMDSKTFVTMSYAIIDTKKKSLTLARAGHNALIVQSSEKSYVECLAPDGIGLGLEHGDVFDRTIIEQKVKYSSGDTFIFYTDGISEAMNSRKEEFGEDRLIRLIESSDHQSSRETRERIIDDVQAFVENAPQHDDITMVVLKAE